MAGETSGLRLSVLALVVMGLFAALFSRLWFLEVAAPPNLIKTVQDRRIKTVQLPAMRGRVVDRDGRILADNRRVLNIVVDRKSIQRKTDRELLFDRLAGVLATSTNDLEKRVTSDKYEPVLPLPLAEDVSEEQAAFLRERAEDYPGVDVQETWQRVYRYAPLASNLIGYLGPIFKEDDIPKLLAKGYQRSDKLGRAGIEQQYEDVLRGKPGFAKFEIDAAGRPVRALEGPENRQEPVPGQDVQLTIDLRIQQYAEQILDAELRKRRLERPPQPINIATGKIDPGEPLKRLFPAGAGSLVVLDTRSAEVLAMASNPPYDARWFSQSLSDAKRQQLFGKGNNPNTPLINRAISGQYQIGSTMKLFTSVAGMLAGTLNSNDKPIVENGAGRYVIPNCSVGEPSGCERRNSGGFKYGSPTLTEALTVSSDTYFYDQGARLWDIGRDQTFQTVLRAFGLGAASGIDLPDENPGYVPDAALKKKFYEKKVISQREGSGYFIGDNINLAVGQGLLSVTPLQLANGYATFANGGVLHQPTITRAILPAGGASVPGQPNVLNVNSIAPTTLREPTPRHPDQAPVELGPQIRTPILDGLKGVSQEFSVCSEGAPCREGTAFWTYRGYDWNAFPVWGKTGTAQDVTQKDEKDDSLYSAFGGTPDSNGVPPYQVTALLEDSGFGSSAAALTARCMFEKLGNQQTLDNVKVSDPLNRNQTRAAVLPPLDDTQKECLHVADDRINQTALGLAE